MNESFDQHAGQSAWPFDGFAAGGHNGGRARSSAVRSTARDGICGASDMHGKSRDGRGRHGTTLSRYNGNVMVQKKVMTENPVIFDRALLRARRRRAAALGPATFLLDRVADELADRLAAVLRRFDLALDLGTPGEAVRAALSRLGSVGTILNPTPSLRATPRAPINSCLPMKRRYPLAKPVLTSWCRRSRCNSSTICPARLCKFAVRSSPTACFLPRSSAARR